MRKALGAIALWVVLALISTSAVASQHVGLSWKASPDPSVSGYRIYYGSTSGYYTNYLTAGNVTNLEITGLVDNVTYFFAAKSYNAAGVESDFSNETIFTGAVAQPGATLSLESSSLALSQRYQFSLASSAPAGMTINPNNGMVTWTPAISQASTTNLVEINLADTLNPGSTISEALLITVADYVNIKTGALVAAAGNDGLIPIILTSSVATSNVVFDLAWPSADLLNPTLSSSLANVNHSVQNFGTHLVLHFWTVSGQIPAGTNQIGQLTFQVAASPATANLSLATSTASVTTATAKTESTTTTSIGNVLVVGVRPWLEPITTLKSEKSLTVYANPQQKYQIESCTNLSSANTWQPVLTYNQTNLCQSVALPPSNSTVFYRIVQ